jgi:hypothetical protein
VALFSPLYVFGALFKNKIGKAVWIHIRVLYSVPLVFISSCYLCQYHAVFIAMALEYILKLGIVIPPALLFLLKIALDIHSLLWFPNEL